MKVIKGKAELEKLLAVSVSDSEDEKEKLIVVQFLTKWSPPC